MLAVYEVLLSVNFWLAIAVLAVLVIAFISNAIKTVPATPPHEALLTIFGRRLKVVLKEGWNFLPLYPLIFSFILIKVGKVNTEFPPQQVRTPDRAVISVSASVTWVPGIKGEDGVKTDPDSYIAYLNSGGRIGVTDILEDTAEDRIKTWAMSNQEGPATWMEAQAMKDDVHVVLAKSLLGDALATVPLRFQDVPTSTWMRFLNEPKSKPSAYDAILRNGWAHVSPTDPNDWNWDGLQRKFDAYSPEEQEELRAAVNARREDIKAIREGRGRFGDRSLGITILRFSVNEVKVEGEVAKAAELEEKERRERDADTMEIDNISDRAKKLKADHPDLTSEQVFRLIQVERGKATRTTIDVSGAKTDAGSDLLGLAGIAKEIVKELIGDRNQGGGQGNYEKGSGSGGKGLPKRERGDYTTKDMEGLVDDLGKGK